MRRAAIIFEGGSSPRNPLEEQIAALRAAVALDTVEKYRRCGVDEVIVATDRPDLAREAERLGARAFDTGAEGGFHFGRALRNVVRASGAGGVVYQGGAALPLISPAEIAWILTALESPAPVVVVNNPQSADLVAWSPADRVERIEPPARDNPLGWLLAETGMERLLIPSSAGVHFDLDTPTDFLTLELSGRAGPRAAAALAALPWPRDRLRAAAAVLERDLPEVALIGRVGTAVVEHFNKNLRVRLRFFSEERGMKALGRIEAGQVVSFLGDLLDDVGPERFFHHLGRVCDAAFIDTRVLLAHRGRRVSEWDRFHSDLGLVDQIRDPWVRRFTEAALGCACPVVLGGHSTVAGGLWVLADRALERLARQGGGAGRDCPP